MASAGETPSQLLGLPAELRDLIYTLALTSDSTCNIADQPALLCVCKQITAEATGIFWSTNSFDLLVDPLNLMDVSERLEKIGRNALSLITSLTIIPDLSEGKPSAVQTEQPPYARLMRQRALPHGIWRAVTRHLLAAGVQKAAIKSSGQPSRSAAPTATQERMSSIEKMEAHFDYLIFVGDFAVEVIEGCGDMSETADAADKEETH